MHTPLGRIVEIAEDSRHLGKDRGFLTVASAGTELGRVPLDDLAGVIATGHGTTLSLNLAAALAERGVPLVLCGANFAPTALLWPISGHHAQQRRMEAQLDRTRPLSKRLWAEIVSAKIARQGFALTEIGAEAGAFWRLSREVRSGDPDNIEAQAARRYWPLMMGSAFRRDPAGAWPNAALNYGYTVLRACTARAICAAGLHPGLGIFHRHPQNAMPLADDLMEPFRPMVDLAVRTLVPEGATEIVSATKRQLAAVLTQDLQSSDGTSPLATCVTRLAQSVAASYLSGEVDLDLPLIGLPRRAGQGAPDDAVPF